MFLTKYLKSLLVELQPFSATLSLPGLFIPFPKNLTTLVCSHGMRDLNIEGQLMQFFHFTQIDSRTKLSKAGSDTKFCSFFARLVVHHDTVALLASSRRSVSPGAAQKTALFSALRPD